MLIAASANAATAVSRLGSIPLNFWAGLAIVVAGIVAIVLVLRRLAQTNKVVLAVVTAVAASIIGFSWIYERNEPDWATPAVSALANFFPTKGKVLAQR
jgi:cytochrome c biogenesis protein CcdA